MGSHPVNLFFRFFLEIVALVSAGLWANHHAEDDWTNYIVTFGIPLTVAVFWGVFNVPNDPSRSGNAPVPVPGWLRLTLELSIFGFATYCLLNIGQSIWGFAFLSLVIIHYALSIDRIKWLLKQK